MFGMFKLSTTQQCVGHRERVNPLQIRINTCVHYSSAVPKYLYINSKNIWDNPAEIFPLHYML